MGVKPCQYCQCPTWFDNTIDKTFTKKDKSIGHGWWREDLSKQVHTRERCDVFKKSEEFMEPQAVQNAQTNPNVKEDPSPLVTKDPNMSTINIPAQTELDKKVLERTEADAYQQAFLLIAKYKGVKKACEQSGIREPPVIGMIFNNTCKEEEK